MQQPGVPATLEKISGLIACAVCLEVVKDPKLLPCQHSFCLGCLNLIVKDNEIACPLCRTVHNVPDPSKLPVDFMKNSLLDIVVQEQRNPQEKVSYCSLCDESENEQATAYCEDCKQFLCLDHQKAHMKDKSSKTHTLQSTEKKVEKVDLGVSSMFSSLSLTDEKRCCVVQKLKEDKDHGKFYLRFTIYLEGASYITVVSLRARDKIVVDNLDIRKEQEGGGVITFNQIRFDCILTDEQVLVVDSHANIEVLLQTALSAGEKRSIIMPLLREYNGDIPEFKEKESILLSLTSDLPRPLLTIDKAKLTLPTPVFPQTYIRGNEEPAGIVLYRKPAFHVQALQTFKVYIDSDPNFFIMELDQAILIGVKPGQAHALRIQTEGYDKEISVTALPSGRIQIFEVYLWWFKMEVKNYGTIDITTLHENMKNEK